MSFVSNAYSHSTFLFYFLQVEPFFSREPLFGQYQDGGADGDVSGKEAASSGTPAQIFATDWVVKVE
jgi:hypothetical protein